MYDRQLAKWYLERQGYLAAVDVNLSDELGSVDAFGVRLGASGPATAVFGVVRGWWHTGAYLTPSLIRSHLQTDRRLLDKAFAAERLNAAMASFGLETAPRRVLFYSKRSPAVAAEAEGELARGGIEVVYLEDVLADALAHVKYDDRTQGTVFQALAMVKGARVFKDMARLARAADRQRLQAPRPDVEPERAVNPQLDLLLAVEEDEDDRDVDA